jgi:hypothetical protein
LEAVEKKAGAAWVDVVRGDALQDLADGVLDGGAVFGERQVEGRAAAAALVRVRYGLARGVVVVAEVFAAKAWAGAAVAIGEDVAALVVLRFGCVVHVPLPTGTCFVQSLRKKGVESGLSLASGLNAKARLLAGPLFSFYFYFIEVRGTNMPTLMDLFFACSLLILSWLCDLRSLVCEFWGLTCDFAEVF